MEDLRDVRSDLAFLRAVAADRGPLPALLGWHLVALGAVFTLAFVHIWAVYAGHAPWPRDLLWLLWLPGALLYLPINVAVHRFGRGMTWGPAAKLFGSAWAALGVMIPPAVIVLMIAQQQTGFPFYRVWPALAFILYGGAWSVAAIGRPAVGYWPIAAGCFATGFVCAGLIEQTVQWLVMAAGLALFMILPGTVIALRARGA